jgi:hypothetical protein
MLNAKEGNEATSLMPRCLMPSCLAFMEVGDHS